MNKDSFAILIMIVLIAFMAILLFSEIYKIKKQGKLIVKMNLNGSGLIVWLILLVFWSFMLIKHIFTDYWDIISDITMPLLWIFIASLNAILSYRGSEIREDGIYHQRFHYKWDILKGYSWISSKELRLHTNVKFNRKIVIQEKLKSEIDEVLKQYLKEIE